MRVLDLFSGAAGGWSLGLARAGYHTVAACEIDPWRRAVFAATHPGCFTYADIRELTAERLRADLGYLPDVVVGSPPCQEISAANCKGAGITDDHLFWEWARLVFEVRPLWCAAENSPRARTDGIDGILDALDQAGYAAWACVVGADNAGANHRRKRLWLIAADSERLSNYERLGGFPADAKSSERRPHGAAEQRVEGQYAVPQRQEGSGGAGIHLRENDPAADGRLAGGARRHADGCVELGAGADGHDARHPALIERLRLGGTLAGSPAESAQAGLHPHCADGSCCFEPNECDGQDCWLARHPDHAPDSDREGLAIGPRLRRHDGEELPAALRDIGLAWPHWNGGITGLAAACAAAGFGAVDDGTDAGLPAGLRNRAIAALGDAVVPQIPEVIGRAIMEALP